jgi:hypothetical protein
VCRGVVTRWQPSHRVRHLVDHLLRQHPELRPSEQDRQVKEAAAQIPTEGLAVVELQAVEEEDLEDEEGSWDAHIEEQVQEYVRRLRANDAGLVDLDLSEHKIGEARARDVAGALLVNTILTSLALGRSDAGHDLGEAGARDITSMLLINTSLKSLDLCNTGLGAAGARELAGALRVNMTLTDLLLGKNCLQEAGVREVAGALCVNTTIRSLCIHDNEMRDGGARAVAGALRVNTTLTHISMHRNGVGDAGAMEMASALQVNTTLNSLALCGGNWLSTIVVPHGARHELGWRPDSLGEAVKQELREVWGARGKPADALDLR